MGHVVLAAFGMVAQMERRFIKERQREGIERAKSEGRYKGGHRRIDRAAIPACKPGGESVAAIAIALGCSRMQIYRLLQSIGQTIVHLWRTLQQFRLKYDVLDGSDNAWPQVTFSSSAKKLGLIIIFEKHYHSFRRPGGGKSVIDWR